MDSRIWMLVLVQLLIVGSSGQWMKNSTDYCPGSLCHCVKMSILKAYCSNLSLDSVQSANLPNSIGELLLDQNEITAVNGSDFAYFQNLIFLDLSINGMQHLVDEAFANLSNLNALNLAHNLLDLSELPTEVFSSLGSLETLMLNNNSIQGNYPDASLSTLQSLKSLSIDGIPYVEFGPGFKNLTNLTTLIVSGTGGQCNISTLRVSALRSVPHVEVLDISFCAIEIIEPGVFLPLDNLQSLNITGNYLLGFKAFGVGMEGITTKFTTLIANYIVRKYSSCVVMRKEYIKNLENTSLTHIHLDDNSIESLEKGTLPLLPKTLEYVSAQRNKFSNGDYLRDLRTMTSLKKVTLSGVSYPISVPDHNNEEYHCDYSQCDEVYGDQEMEDVDWLSDIMQSHNHWLRDSEIEPVKLFNLSLPPNLQWIQYNFSQLAFNIGVIHFKADNLKYLDLSSNLVQFQSGRLHGLEHVSYIDLSNNLARQMSEELFFECVGLEHLDLSYNLFGWQIHNDKNGSIFQYLPNLKTLILANTGLKGLTGYVISKLHSLRTLNISQNGLYNFAPVMGNLTKLMTIDASDNEIKRLTKWAIECLTLVKQQSENFTFILRGNPLSCDCNNLDTLEWLYSSGVSPPNMTGYFCIQVNNQPWNFNNKDEFRAIIDNISHQCTNRFGLALGCFAIFLAAVGLVVGAILYRYRWKLRYLYYAARLRYLAQDVPEEDEEEFMFDAFVSYADEDRGFVINDMRSRLEHESSMTLNIHHRDFMPGEPIVSNIVGAIKKSRKMLVLLSPNFLKSYWCKYELHMAQMESISTGRDIIIVIMYESVPAKHIPPEFLHLLQSDSYIEYPSSANDVPVFWSHLNAAIRRRTNRNSSQTLTSP